MQLWVIIKDLWSDGDSGLGLEGEFAAGKMLEYSAAGFFWFALFFFEKGPDIIVGEITGDEMGYSYIHSYHKVLAGEGDW